MILRKILNYFLCFFYILFVFLWFKDNIFPFKKINISYLFPLACMGIIGGWHLLLFIRKRRHNLSLRIHSVLVLVLLLVLLALAFRIPFLVNNFGLINSDSAVPALMGKHISEGKLPPVYYYGQGYMGSLSEHLQALFFKVFGFSNFMFKFSILLFYLGFLVIQFYFIREVFSQTFAFYVGLFYCLPIGHLGSASLDTTGAFPLVLLLGSSIMYVAYLIAFKDKTRLVPWLGFLMGLAFWTHQISICFILPALLLILGKFKFCLKKYLLLGLTTVIGCLPVIMLEISRKFPLLKFLTPGGGDAVWADKLTRTARMTTHLLALKDNPAFMFLLLLLVVGLISLVSLSFKAKKILPSVIFVLFFLLFYLIFIFSGFSDREAVRYFYPVYFGLPVIFFSGCLLFKSKWRYRLMAGLVIVLVFICNGNEILAAYGRTRKRHTDISRITSFMKETGYRYWQGDYWAAYLLTALSREEVVVDSYSVNRYFPYRLEFHNVADNRNYVFYKNSMSVVGRRGKLFKELLSSLDIGFQYQEMGDYTLVYDIETEVYKESLIASLPESLPVLDLTGMEVARGFLYLEFKNQKVKDSTHVFRLHIEIPGYSAKVRGLNLSKTNIRVKIPHPPSGSFPVKYCYDYKGLVIPATLQELSYTITETGPRNRVLYLSGDGPMIAMADEEMRILEKHIKIEVNRRLKADSKVRLHLYSPFDFQDPYWYGDYFQEVTVYEGSKIILKQPLQDGENTIEFGADPSQIQATSHIFTLEFKYHMPFAFAPMWKTAALLRKIEIR